MADESKLSIVIDAENRAKSVFSDAQNDLKGFGKSFEDTAKGFKQFGVGIEAVGVAIGGLLVTTGLYAARVEVLDTVLQNVGKVSNVSSDILKEQENVIKKLGITTQEAKETLILFMQGQLDVAQASKIARVAQDLAVIAGVNSSEATKTLTQAIISQEPMLLRNFGIVQNLNDVYLSYGKEIGIASEKVSENGKITTSWTRDLTDVEKRQAMLNMILAEGAKVSGTYEAAMGDAGKQLTSLPRYIDEAKLAFGQAFIPIIGEAVKILTNLLKAFTALSPETQKIITYVAMATATFTLILGPILLLIGFLPAIASGFAIILGPVGGVIITFTVLMATIGLVGYTIYYAVKNWQDICVGFGIYFDEFKIKIIGIWDS
ncbi:MAG: hypothetical protein NTY22_07680, partial [Proteobacteria bacterium]|nr:hypothetical protein [Pseudomonadota bacterium]